jgi:type II secretory pathway pseudopilin PulG
LVEIMIVVSIIGILLNIAAPSFVYARDSGQARACVANLHNINMAKEQWAFQNNIAANSNAQPLWLDSNGVSGLSDYIRGGVPVCPSGGTYNYGTASMLPTCSYVSPVNEPGLSHTF